MTTSTAGKPLDLAQFEGHTPRLSIGYAEYCVLIDSESGTICATKDQQKIHVLEAIASRVSWHPELLAECHRQREEIARLREALTAIAIQDSGNHFSAEVNALARCLCDKARAALGRQE